MGQYDGSQAHALRELELVIIVAAILARATSPLVPDQLLPRRSLVEIRGQPVLAWIVRRLQASKCLATIVTAVGDSEQDAHIIGLAQDLGLKVYSGFPESILERLHLVAEREQADHIVRINGNFPLVDPLALDRLLEAHLDNQADFSLNSHYHGLIYGLGVEIFSHAVLNRIVKKGLSHRQQTFGSWHLHHHPEKYRIYYQAARKTAPHLRVSVDYQPDVTIISEILDNIAVPDNERIIDFLSGRPDLVAAQACNVPAEVSLEKAMLFPEKMLAVRQNNCRTFDISYPISVELSLTNQCNHRCIWCSDAGIRCRRPGQIKLEVLGPLFAALKNGGTRGIVIEGGGEPTLHPDFHLITETALQTGLALGLISNGYLLPPTPPHRFEWIRISLDAASRDQYRELKGVDGFDRVIHNLMTLAASNPRPILGVGYVLTKANDDPVPLEQLVLFLRQIGINYIHFRPVVDHPALVSTADLNYLKKFETDSFSVNLGALTANRDTGNLGLPCLAHSLSAVVAADGSLYLCGRLNGAASWEPLGNLYEQPFEKIWTSDQRRRQVRLVSEAHFCRHHCPPCRMTKYNRLLNDMEKIRTRNFI